LRADTCHRWRGFATPSLDGGGRTPRILSMTAKKSSADARRQRLAKALKANIARRKAKAKDRSAEEKPRKD